MPLTHVPRLALITALAFAALSSASVAFAFPEMVRHGYTNCTTCHISPTGGGLLTDYGRGLSHELLSTWGSEAEARPLEGLIPAPGDDEKLEQWFGVGGDIRAVQVHKENEFARTGRFIWMQAMLDLAYRYKAATAAISIGKFDHKNVWSPQAERFFALFQPNDTSMIRVGRVVPAYGLNIAEHISPTRDMLGFGLASERDLAEYHYIGETWNAAIGYSKGPRDGISNEERAVYAQVARALNEKHKVGLSLWQGESETTRRKLAGLYAAIGFTEHFYFMTELDLQWLTPDGGAEINGLYGYHKLGYEFKKGMHAFALVDHAQNDLSKEKSLIRHWGGGVAFYPRPHFEISGTWTREQKKSISDQEGDYAWLLFHYYL
jgi:hypothetical protein